MIPLEIPGFKGPLEIRHVVLDFNGTLAIDGKLIPGAKEILNELSEKVTLHVLTGNTFGTVEDELKEVRCKVVPLPSKDLGKEKEKYLRQLDTHQVISIGNGRNDALILRAAVIGILVMQKEGAAAEAIMAADVVCPDIFSALDLLKKPLRLIATLRN